MPNTSLSARDQAADIIAERLYGVRSYLALPIEDRLVVDGALNEIERIYQPMSSRVDDVQALKATAARQAKAEYAVAIPASLGLFVKAAVDVAVKCHHLGRVAPEKYTDDTGDMVVLFTRAPAIPAPMLLPVETEEALAASGREPATMRVAHYRKCGAIVGSGALVDTCARIRGHLGRHAAR